VSQPKFDPKNLKAFKFKAKESLVKVLEPEKTKEEPKKKKPSRIIAAFKKILILFIIILLASVIDIFFFQVSFVPTDSMEATLGAGDGIIVNKLLYGIANPFWGTNDTERLLLVINNPFYKKGMPISKIRYMVRFSKGPRRGDIVMVKTSTKYGEMSGRITGLPGELVKIKKGTIYINGKKMIEKFPVIKGGPDLDYAKVPQDSYFIIGDNMADPSNSEKLGMVSRENIVGILAGRIWPLNKIRTFK